MPITPLPANNTKRFWVIYLYGPHTHRVQCRTTNDFPDASALANLQFDLNLIKPVMNSEWSAIGLEVAVQGSDVRNPVAGWTTISGTGGATTEPQHFVRAVSIRGRSTSGRKVKYLYFGSNFAEAPDFEIDPTLTGFATMIASMEGRASMYLAIDGSKPVLRTNLLEDYNDHWQKQIRP